MMAPTSQVRAHVVRSFNDAGSGAAFQKDETPLLDEGTFLNYLAAGLVTPCADDPETDAPPRQRGRPSKSNEIPPAAKAE